MTTALRYDRRRLRSRNGPCNRSLYQRCTVFPDHNALEERVSEGNTLRLDFVEHFPLSDWVSLSATPLVKP